MQDIMKLCDVVRQTGFELHRYLGGGMLEKVYENGLVHRLRKMGLKIEQQKPLQIFDEDGTLLGEYAADLFIEDVLIGEVKAVRAYTDEHVAQILGYFAPRTPSTAYSSTSGPQNTRSKNSSGPPPAMPRSHDHAVSILRILRFFAARGPV